MHEKYSIRKIQVKLSQLLRIPYLNSLLRSTPVNREWGFNRGVPIDRFYIHRFLSKNSDLLRGNVLSVGDDFYAQRYKHETLKKSDVLHISDTANATIVADLTNAPQVASNSFDCFLLIQTLQLIYDVRSAIETTHRILKPGGTVLATFPGITPLKDEEWNEFWCWNFTTTSALKLFLEFFDADEVEVLSHGNVKAATAFLHGLSVKDCGAHDLILSDSAFPVIITVKARKNLSADKPAHSPTQAKPE